VDILYVSVKTAFCQFLNKELKVTMSSPQQTVGVRDVLSLISNRDCDARALRLRCASAAIFIAAQSQLETLS
jgi:hypothetical protein